MSKSLTPAVASPLRHRLAVQSVEVGCNYHLDFDDVDDVDDDDDDDDDDGVDGVDDVDADVDDDDIDDGDADDVCDLGSDASRPSPGSPITHYPTFSTENAHK